jgi:hypothetical protein
LLSVVRNQGIEIRPTRIGRGLIAARPLNANRLIIHLAGRIVDAGVMTKIGGRFADNCLRFGPETYLDPGEEAGAYLNHSCRPNAFVRKSRNRLFLVSLTAIRRGAEITIDYSTILGDDDIWTMRCRCGARECRRRIRSFGTLPLALRDRYVEHGAVPKYILATLD